jgi:hypothetical protein
MIYPHVMRLREPWRRSGHDGRIRHQRNFNWPAALDDREQLWLVVESVIGSAEFKCNDALLGEKAEHCPQAEFEITSLISDRNEITIDVTMSGEQDATPLFGAVRLEVRLAPATLDGGE